MLAGVSAKYYTRMERGNLAGFPSRFWTPSPRP